jgi:hypothetical protein
MALLWTDLYKPVKDFFSKEYNTAPLSIEVDANALSAKSDEWLAPKLERSASGATTVSAEIGQRFATTPLGPVKALVTINGNGRLKFEGKLTRPIGPLASDVTVTGDIGSTDAANDKIDAQVDLRRARTGGTLIARLPKNGKHEFEASFATAFRAHYYFGGQALFGKTFNMSNATVGVAHRVPGRVIAATIDRSLITKLGIVLASKESPANTEVGTELAVGKAVDLTVGFKTTVLDGDQKVEWRGKANNRGQVGLSFKRRLTPTIVGTLSTDVSLTDNKGKFGLKLVWV